MITALDHVQLAAPPGSEPVLRAYYVTVLGMREVPKPPALAARGGCWFEAAGVRLHLGIEENFHPAAKAHPGMRVTDIERYGARLEGLGAKVVWDADLPHHRRFYSQDPVGNRLEFLESDGEQIAVPEPAGEQA
ncbi:VOC family protein [Streptomyces sp. CA-294286]|uniref:VOC family protein n=1 Tax=Streptomyces sp. CA-294286 TaxID=3240070 RepID=UPI003D9469B3